MSSLDSSGGKVLNEQKMDRRSFARVANKKNSGGFYVNLVYLKWIPVAWRNSRQSSANDPRCSVCKSHWPMPRLSAD